MYKHGNSLFLISHWSLIITNIFDLVNILPRLFTNNLPSLPSDVHSSLTHPLIYFNNVKHTPISLTAHMSVFLDQVTTSCGETRKTVSHTPTCTCRQEVVTYLTDFIDLSSLLAGLLPGDSFLLRRKASRFFMSLALGERKIEEEKEGESWKEKEEWKKDLWIQEEETLGESWGRTRKRMEVRWKEWEEVDKKRDGRNCWDSKSKVHNWNNPMHGNHQVSSAL